MLAITGSFVCYSVVVLFACVVLLCVLFEGFKVCWCVWCVQVRQNNSVGRCNSVGVVIHKVIGGLWMVLLVWMVLWIRCGWLGNEKTLAWALP